MKILVVDDDKNLNSGISAFLNSNDITTVSAFDGEDGYDKINDEKFDLILSDLQMPKMNGIELLKKIKAKESGITIYYYDGICISRKCC